MAKNFATDVADRLTYDAVQVLGGMGYMRESLVERLYRDNRILHRRRFAGNHERDHRQADGVVGPRSIR